MCTLLGQAIAIILACGSPGEWKAETVEGRPALAFERTQVSADSQRGTKALTFTCDPAAGTVVVSLVVRPLGKKNRKPSAVLLEGRSAKVRLPAGVVTPSPDGLVTWSSEPGPYADALAAFAKEGTLSIKVAGRTETLWLDAVALLTIGTFRSRCGQVGA